MHVEIRIHGCMHYMVSLHVPLQFSYAYLYTCDFLACLIPYLDYEWLMKFSWDSPIDVKALRIIVEIGEIRDGTMWQN